MQTTMRTTLMNQWFMLCFMPPSHLSASFILIAVFSKKIIGISRYCLDM